MRVIIAGQAVYEGVMMHSQSFVAIAVRAANGSIITSVRGAKCGQLLWRWMRVPFARGIVALYEAVSCGFYGLRESLELAGKRQRLSHRTIFAIELPIGLAVSFSMFVVIPHMLADALRGASLYGSAPVRLYSAAHFALNLVEGIMRLLVFIAFVLMVRLLPAMRRYFAYHGAEHKAINAYESGSELTVDELIRQPRLHGRCGTTFMLTVFIVAMVLFSFVPWTSIPIRLIGRLLLLPAVASLSYEAIIAGTLKGATWAKVINALGMQVQRLTTAEPSVQQLEVALAALSSLLQSEAATSQGNMDDEVTDNRCKGHNQHSEER
ncbi:MAG: hypothetical protein GDYSWBUE_000699 [Candidatus Fervidibacterota bacterium]